MTPWATVADLKAKVQREWDQGVLARALWLGPGSPRGGLELPYRVALRGPTSAEWSDRFDEARAWIASLGSLPLEWREVNHPRLGRNRVPVAALWNDAESLLAFIGKKSEAQRFRALAESIVVRLPALAVWAGDHPHAVLAVGEDWPAVLAFLEWRLEHPHPGVYLRQVDLPGVHTKFLETRRGLLTDLLDQLLPAPGATGVGTPAARFAQRFGFLAKPRLVRFRHLDPRWSGPRDLTWRLDDWARWETPPGRVFVTENEVNFLAFPDHRDGLVVFGAGYGFEGWDAVSWLARVDLWYWGDLDTHGFAILDQLRKDWPFRSLLMDERTLLAHRPLWGQEPTPTDRVLPSLTPEEQRVYQGLVRDEWAPRVRLEQERIGFRWLEEALERLPPLGGRPLPG